MANRSYLYSASRIPGESIEKNRLVGISEWSYAVPVVYRILVSGNAQLCPSSIWQCDEKIAIVGDYELGLKRLNNFFDAMDREDAQGVVAETLDFLESEGNRGNYFVLECGEIFDMQDEDLHVQAKRLFRKVQNIDKDIQKNLACLRKPGSRSLVSRFFGRGKQARDEDDLAPVYALGLGNWNNLLYYSFT